MYIQIKIYVHTTKDIFAQYDTSNYFYLQTKVKEKYNSWEHTYSVFAIESKLYIPSTLNNSNRAYTFICLGRAGRFGQC